MVMFLICLAGTIAVAFLPETVGATLPETLEDASEFGINDKFFSYKPDHSKREYELANMEDKPIPDEDDEKKPMNEKKLDVEA